MTPANKGPFQRRLQAQQESLWMGICLKCYQNQDHSCGSTKLSLITVPWLHLGSHVNLEKQKERRRGVEERSDLFSVAHVQWQSSSFLCVDHPPAHGGGHTFTSAAKLSLTVCRKTIRAQSLPACFTLRQTHDGDDCPGEHDGKAGIQLDSALAYFKSLSL